MCSETYLKHFAKHRYPNANEWTNDRSCSTGYPGTDARRRRRRTSILFAFRNSSRKLSIPAHQFRDLAPIHRYINVSRVNTEKKRGKSSSPSRFFERCSEIEILILWHPRIELEITWWIDYTNCCNNNNDFSCSNSIAEKKTFINAWWWKLMGYGLLFFFHLIKECD